MNVRRHSITQSSDTLAATVLVCNYKRHCWTIKGEKKKRKEKRNSGRTVIYSQQNAALNNKTTDGVCVAPSTHKFHPVSCAVAVLVPMAFFENKIPQVAVSLMDR